MTKPAQIPPERRYVAYYRVSTGDQGKFGFSIEAQETAVRKYVAGNPGHFIRAFSEVISGRRNSRPELTKALALCKITRSILVIARLDRLSRSVELIAGLMESGVEFVAVDFPHANKFTIHILAALAEYESNLISDRMKGVSAALKARGVRFAPPPPPGGYKLPPGCWQVSAKVRREKSMTLVQDIAPLVLAKIAEGKSYAVIAIEFNTAGVLPPRGRPWTKQSVTRIARLSWTEGIARKAILPPPRLSCAKARVKLKLDRIGSVLVESWKQGKSYAEIATELAAREIPGPRGGLWGPASIGRYLKKALGVVALRNAQREVQ